MASNLLFFSENQLTTECVQSTAKFGGLATIWGPVRPPGPQRGTRHWIPVTFSPREDSAYTRRVRAA